MSTRGELAFFRYARLRHEAYLKKMAGVPKGAQSDDPILNQYSFTNVFRELDKTTAWFREKVRDPLRDRPEVLLATVVFRLLNRIEIGEAVFCQLEHMGDALGPMSAFDKFVGTGDVKHLRSAIKKMVPAGPYCTGAYIISSPPGYDKLNGVMEVIRRFVTQKREIPFEHGSEMGWSDVASLMLSDGGRHFHLEAAWDWFRQFDYFGPFHSYEIVTDLRWTALLERAPDIMSWANIGPGCKRGAARVLTGGLRKPYPPEREVRACMEDLLTHASDARMWPWQDLRWEMREVEHTLCEFDKFERVRRGEGRPRSLYR